MATLVGIVDFSGSFSSPAPTATAQSTSRLGGKLGVITGSLNVRRGRQRDLYRRLVTGEATKSEVGESAGVGDSNLRATPPSWTQLGSGLGHAYVAPALSSSHHEVSRLNAHNSGSFALEQSPVPASASFYYSKETRLARYVYSLTASADLPILPPQHEQSPSIAESDPRPWFHPVSGSFRANSAFFPSRFRINVPRRGKIRDIKVWVEFIHDVRDNAHAYGASPTNTRHGLGSVAVSLRSPNVSFRAAHPLWNSSYVAQYLKRQFLTNFAFIISTDGDGVYRPFGGIPELLQNSYLLWAGHGVDQDLDWALTTAAVGIPGQLGPPVDYSPMYAEWDNDVDMRTTFWDSSRVRNPRDLTNLYQSATAFSPGPGLPLSSSEYGSLHDSPNYQAISTATVDVVEGYTGSWTVPTVGGLNYPWFYDGRIGETPALLGRPVDRYIRGVPAGWLSSGSNTASLGPNENEFPTSTGSNIGPVTIKPVYPMLDDLFAEKLYDAVATTRGTSAQQFFPTARARIVGFRPGLRGTQIQGPWDLMIGVSSDVLVSSGSLPYAFVHAGIWFRQFRLELTVDEGEGPDLGLPGRSRKFNKPSYVPGPAGARRVQILSGSAEWDVGINYVYVDQPPEHSRTVGITSNTGSSPDFAVFTRLTGALANRVSESPWWYLQNEFGTPFIPISSGSGEPPSMQLFERIGSNTREMVSEVLRPRPSIPQAHRLSDAMSRFGRARTRLDLLQEKMRAAELTALSGTA